MLKHLTVLTWVLFAAGAALHVVRMLSGVVEPVEIDYGEGIILFQASQILDLHQAFRPIEQYPHIVFHYPPVYHLLLRLLTPLFSNPLLAGRLISMVSTLWIAGLFVWLVRRTSRRHAPARTAWLAALFACACALHLPALEWVPYARVDLLGLALQFTALALICAGLPSLPNHALAFLLLLLGLYTKQSLVAIPAAAILLVAAVRPMRALWLTLALIASGGGILLMLAWVTDGGVLKHWLLYNLNPFYVRSALAWQLRLSANLAPLVAAGLAASALTFPLASGRDWRRSLGMARHRLAASPLRRAGLGFGVAFLFSFLTSWSIGKEGANLNYCLEWQFALCPLAGIFVMLLVRRWNQRDRAMLLMRPLVVVLFAVTTLQLGAEAAHDCGVAIGWPSGARRKLIAARREQAELVRVISSFTGPVICENMTALQLAGKTIPFEPAIIKQTAETGIFNETGLLNRTSSRFFDAVILDKRSYSFRFTPRMLKAIRENYRLQPFKGPNYLLYVRPGLE